MVDGYVDVYVISIPRSQLGGDPNDAGKRGFKALLAKQNRFGGLYITIRPRRGVPRASELGQTDERRKPRRQRQSGTPLRDRTPFEARWLDRGR
jgi:hypothetical protein